MEKNKVEKVYDQIHTPESLKQKTYEKIKQVESKKKRNYNLYNSFITINCIYFSCCHSKR